ncbi:MAG TPA: sugar phosphate isomerase/epimerase [Chthonomonas sp.]|uniref:sugar phosphate isomerase/epimerase family protein n=1 Tax=Chthonomonas sp. TaxID=2282153 RepID=UPI002B4B1EC7|nr:sugar phosphate isomerase/epimerase [Chthonomonas sp.]HLH79977.1 sugar phosphate isomerase/epimerase [Chthonomonas sp.]
MPFSRRALLQGALGGAATLALDASKSESAESVNSPYGPFKMGIQSYSLRHFNLDEALDITQQLGLHYWEGFMSHIPLTNDSQQIASFKQKLAAHNIRMLAYGVVGFSNNEAEARRIFEFAKAMDIPVLSAYPAPDSLPLLDRLTREYRIAIAIHNHGPGDTLYGHPDQVLKAVAGRNPLVGACEDTGHMIMAKEDPVAAEVRYGKRLLDVHLKAAKVSPNGGREFADIGDPDSLLDTIGFLDILLRLRYNRLVALEYELHESDPVPSIQSCLELVRHAWALLQTVVA